MGVPLPRASDELGVLNADIQQGTYGEDLVKLIVTAAGFGCGPSVDKGDGVDLVISRTHPRDEPFRPPNVELQVKTVRAPKMVAGGNEISYELDSDHYNTLCADGSTSRYLIIVTVPGADSRRWTGQGEGFYVFQEGVYWRDLRGEERTGNKSKIAVRVPTKQRYNRSAVHQHMREARQRYELLWLAAGGGK